MDPCSTADRRLRKYEAATQRQVFSKPQSPQPQSWYELDHSDGKFFSTMEWSMVKLYSMVLQWFSVVGNHRNALNWSNEGMVTIHRYGLV